SILVIMPAGPLPSPADSSFQTPTQYRRCGRQALETPLRRQLPTGNTEFAKQLGCFAQRQTDHRRIAAPQLVDEHGRQPLDTITARLVTWFAAGPVGLDFRVADGAEAHLAADHASRLAPTTD